MCGWLSRRPPPGAKDAGKTFRDARGRDPAFAAAWEDALNAAIGDAEKSMWEMGVEGVVEREQFDEDGNLRNRVIKRDVRALQLYLAARVPEYRTQRVVEAKVDSKVETSAAPPPDLSKLTDSEVTQLERLVAKGLNR